MYNFVCRVHKHLLATNSDNDNNNTSKTNTLRNGLKPTTMTKINIKRTMKEENNNQHLLKKKSYK